MTIEELLTVALEHVGMADAAADGSLGLETAGQHAAIAQAAATTAQAMILREMTTNGTNFGENIRWLRVDTGE